jgi:hypothetical protein
MNRKMRRAHAKEHRGHDHDRPDAWLERSANGKGVVIGGRPTGLGRILMRKMYARKATEHLHAELAREQAERDADRDSVGE